MYRYNGVTHLIMPLIDIKTDKSRIKNHGF